MELRHLTHQVICPLSPPPCPSLPPSACTAPGPGGPSADPPGWSRGGGKVEGPLRAAGHPEGLLAQLGGRDPCGPLDLRVVHAPECWNRVGAAGLRGRWGPRVRLPRL